MARMSTQMVAGNANNMVATIAGAAARYRAALQPRVDPGACRCHGGDGNCTGCKAELIYKTHRRSAGLNGVDGMPGQPVTINLAKGRQVGPGEFRIIVLDANGAEQQYLSIYRLELEDFKIEDENGDSIFEPGEHLFIRHIKVRNTGMTILHLNY
jgi:hypothetical protein